MTIDAPTGPGGVQAVATAILTSGSVTGFSVNSDNSGYLGVPTVQLSPPAAGTTATATANVSGGAVTSITINSGHAGTGYTSTSVVTIDPPAGSMDSFLYGATLSADAFSVATIPYLTLAANTGCTYGSITRDALAAINFGYLNGVYGKGTASWFGAAPTAFPFALARAQNDGYYNPWAAVLYNNSDAYGFAFSDRSGPSPAIGLQAGQTLRITLLPDKRLDSPKPTITPSANSLLIQWPEIANATGYLITVLAPSDTAPVSVPAAPGLNSYTLNTPSPGTPYTITVAATAMANGQTVTSPAQPVQVSTTGTLQPYSGGTVDFYMAMSWIPGGNIAPTPSVYFNGPPALIYDSSSQQWLNGGVNATISGAIAASPPLAANQYVMTLYDGNNAVLFTNIITVTLEGTSTAFTVSQATLYGNAQPLTLAPPGVTYATIGTSGGTPLTVSVPFTPNPLKAFAPIAFPTLTYNQWIGTFPDFINNAINDDPDGDGISNLMEYFQGSDPTESGLFNTSTTTVTATEVLFTYRQSSNISGTTAQVEWSTDLQTWQTNGVVTDPPQSVAGHLEVTAHVPRAGEQRVFTRLRVTLQARQSRRCDEGERREALRRARRTATSETQQRMAAILIIINTMSASRVPLASATAMFVRLNVTLVQPNPPPRKFSRGRFRSRNRPKTGRPKPIPISR